MNRLKTSHAACITAALMVMVTAQTGCDRLLPEVPPTGNGTPLDDTDRPLGETSFISADGQNGQNRGDEAGGADGDFEASPPDANDPGADDRTVEEGDIYRVIDSGRIANLNSYRGLQIIDVNNADEPKVIGRLQIAGHPVEMYVNGDNVFILMNNWYGYYGNREDVVVDQYYGGMVAAVDISDVTNPILIGQAPVQGWIQKSRLTKGSAGAALYVAAGGYDYWQDDDGNYTWETKTYVKSFDVSDGTLTEKSFLDLGGYVSDIQATTEALLVARRDWNGNNNDDGSTVSLIDIRDPRGDMIVGDEVIVAGFVESQFNMDLYNGVLRIVSGSWWGGDRGNHIQTFDASDFSTLIELDHEEFGDGQDLYATLFVGNKAFFVTYLRQDPFHAFEITDDGDAIEHNEFVVSGWNDFFRAVHNQSRLVGIGINDEDGRKLAVSLYDITNLANTEPLIERAEVEADYSWSEANWDHRAFSVVENAVSATSPDGTSETGLVLLPFSGWSDSWETYTSAVQIFTFSETTLTRRALMVHGTPVRRSFLADDSLTANLSEAELSLFDTANPDEPVARGRVELAPNYTDLLFYGDYAARVKNSTDYYYYWWGSNADLPPATVEIIARGAHPDTAPALATIEIPFNAQVYASGDALITVNMIVDDTSNYPYTYESTVSVYDLSNPTMPVLARSFITDKLAPSYGGGYWYDDCWDCGWGYYGYWGQPSTDVIATGNSLAFLERIWEQESVGTVHQCNTYASEDSNCDSDGNCTYFYGNRNCSSLEGEPMVCYGGEFYRCTYSDNGNSDWECDEIDEDTIDTETNCYDYEQYRYWQRFELEVLDLTDLTDAHLANTVTLPDGDEGVSVLADTNAVWVSYKRPVDVPGTSLGYVRYFARKMSLANPDEPTLGAEINVPGQLLAVDGNRIITRDFLWGNDIVETSLNRLHLAGNLAILDGIHRFENELVLNVQLDGSGHVLASHRLAWQFVQEYGVDDVVKLAVLDANASSLPLVSDVDVDNWATLKSGIGGRALFQVPGGLLVMNLDNPAAPFASAYFPTRGWPWRFHVDGGDVVAPAGRYGIYQFDLDTYNLLPIAPL